MRWNTLRLALFAGALYDLAVGLLIVTCLRALAGVLPIPFPAEPVYARLCGLLMMGLGALYCAAAVSLPYSIGSVWAAIAIRMAGGLYLLIYPFVDGAAAKIMSVFGAVDLLFGLWTLITLRIAQKRI